MRIRTYLLAQLLCVMFLLSCCSCSVPVEAKPADNVDQVETTDRKEQEDTRVHVNPSASFISLTLSEAIEASEIIVYGTIVQKSESKVYDAPNALLPYKDALYSDVILDVIDCPKGDAEKAKTFYKEIGGENDEKIYRFNDFPLLEPGTTVLLFLRDDGFVLTNNMFIPREDGFIGLEKQFLPKDCETLPVDNPAWCKIHIDDFLEMIRQEVAAQAQTPLQTAP